MGSSCPRDRLLGGSTTSSMGSTASLFSLLGTTASLFSDHIALSYLIFVTNATSIFV